jgi:hypothetical protein
MQTMFLYLKQFLVKKSMKNEGALFFETEGVHSNKKLLRTNFRKKYKDIYLRTLLQIKK